MARIKHEQFLLEYIRNGSNGAAAWRKVSPLNKVNPGVYAHRLLNKPHIAAKLEAMRARMIKKADITIDRILADYQEALDIAKQQAKPADIVNAATAQAKLVGLLKDRVEQTNINFDSMDSPAEILQAVSDAAGPEAASALGKALGYIPNEEKPAENESLRALDPLTEAVN